MLQYDYKTFTLNDETKYFFTSFHVTIVIVLKSSNNQFYCLLTFPERTDRL